MIKNKNKLSTIRPTSTFKSVNIGGGCPTDRNSQPPRYLHGNSVSGFTLELTNKNAMIGLA